jgi:hypothetical protein
MVPVAPGREKTCSSSRIDVQIMSPNGTIDTGMKNKKTILRFPEHLTVLLGDAHLQKNRDSVQIQFCETRQAVKFVSHARTAGYQCRYDLVTLPRVVIVYDNKDSVQ